MKVILLEDVKKQGKKDQIIDVSDGYAKYLINNKLGVPATETNKKILDKDLKNKEMLEQQHISDCQTIANKLKNVVLTFKVKTGANDKVFGNISAKQIHEELTKLGYTIDKKKINIDSPIDSLGNHIVEIKVNINIKVSK